MAKFSLSRRRFIGNAIGLATVSSIPLYWYHYSKPKPPVINIHRPGMDFGHKIRDYAEFPEPATTWSCDLMILGSGGAALTAAWKLKKEGKTNFILLEGPEPNGNNAGMDNQELHYPTGAHYLALPSPESRHIREMLADIGVLYGDPYLNAPEYDETVLVHAPEERLLRHGNWQEAMLPQVDEDSNRFFKLVEELSASTGSDEKKLFAIPLILSSEDAKWRELDQITFEQWLTQNNYSSTSLRWYLNYCCRDDYGQGIEKISAWAGLHYFCSRTGEAQHVEKGAILTWQDGLASLSNKLRQYIGFQQSTILQPDAGKQPQLMSGSVFKITEQKDHVELLIGTSINNTFQTVRVLAKKVISGMPLYITARLIDDMEPYGFTPYEHHPVYAPWMIANFIFTQYPKEQQGAPLAWDNVIEAGKGLGYVVSTHQLIRAARPERTAFTAYHALDHEEPPIVRAWLVDAKETELAEMAARDLKLAYGEALWPHLQQIDITLRGHAMATPTPGYLSNPGLRALRENNSRLLFAHADLSGYSVFEESAWWGYQAALKCLK